jgi:hypothetical protein
MVNISIRSPAIIDYVTGRFLIMLAFASPHLDTPDENDLALSRPSNHRWR